MITAAQEYETLREELSQSKRYVIERPLLIVAVGVAAMTTDVGSFREVIPVFLAGLLLFNFWFTANRLMSGARIVAYIQVVLESGDTAKWRGWETSLRKYRMWLKEDPIGRSELVNARLDQRAVPDALTYYAPIFQLHMVLAGLCLLAGALISDLETTIGLVSLGGLVVLAGAFSYYGWMWRPSKMRSLIERNTVIWRLVLGFDEDSVSE